MKIENHIKISKLPRGELITPKGGFFSIVWIIGNIEELDVGSTEFKYIDNTLFFISPMLQWRLVPVAENVPEGYIMNLSNEILDEPFLDGLEINEMRVLHPDHVHRAKIIPGIEIRLKSILEMLEELLTTNLNHREDAILALVNTFFVYCDGQCDFKLSYKTRTRKAELAYKFTRLLSSEISRIKSVKQYAADLNISPIYLNECIHYTLGVSTKSLILEHLVMLTRHALKFSDKSIKEISYDLGFSSPSYFSSFCKEHIGHSPFELKYEK